MLSHEIVRTTLERHTSLLALLGFSMPFDDTPRADRPLWNAG